MTSTSIATGDFDLQEQPYVYIHSKKDFAWIPGKVISVSPSASPPTATVLIVEPKDWNDYTFTSGKKDLQAGQEVTVKLSDYPGNVLPLQNVNENGVLVGEADMADLPHLHEAAILYNLKDLNARGIPYSRVGDIVVAMNPFQWINCLYSKKQQEFYARALVDIESSKEIDLEYSKERGCAPHVYETSSLAYRGLAVDKRDQAILVSGESGSGKTETVKIVLSHLAMLQERILQEDIGAASNTERAMSAVVTRVLESNPIFEAFGNAKTSHNDNSSRFGKFTRLQFGLDESSDKAVPPCPLIGSHCDTYLLEKPRVVGHIAGERTFHIFYQLLAATEEFKSTVWDGLTETSNESFKYVGHTDTVAIGGVTDAESWHKTAEELSLFGIVKDRLITLMRTLCVVLQLGNLTFGPDPADEERAIIMSTNELSKLVDIMGVSTDVITAALTERTITAGGVNQTVFLNASSSKDSCDSLAKEIYEQIFQWIVNVINEETRCNSSELRNVGTINLLDLFGFESFNVNRFEQFCINYANEKLQQKYLTDNFCALQQEYASEGIDLFDFASVDNSKILSLIEGRMGLVVVLNEECVRPKGNDSSFVYKSKSIHRDSPCLIDEKLNRPWEFGVNHYAGPVKYDARKFVESNSGKISHTLLECAAKSNNSLIQSWFKAIVSKKMAATTNARMKSRRGWLVSQTTSSKFQSQLSSMLKHIETTKTRYVRCIKPNKLHKPGITDHWVTLVQLLSAGLLQAISISRETYPNYLTYKEVLDRFRCLLPEGFDTSSDLKSQLNDFLSQLLHGVERDAGGSLITPFACGNTKIYFRAGALGRLDTARVEVYSVNAIVLQRWARKFTANSRYAALKEATIFLQASLHRNIARNSYMKKRKAALTIACLARVMISKSKLVRLRANKAIIVLQNRWRARESKMLLEKFQNAARVIQRNTRAVKNKTVTSSVLSEWVEAARRDEKLKALLLKIAKAKKEKSSYDPWALLDECEEMLIYLGEEVYKFRSKNSDLKIEVAEQKNVINKIETSRSSSEAARSATNINSTHLAKKNQVLTEELNDSNADIACLKNIIRVLRKSHADWKSKEEGKCRLETESIMEDVRTQKKALELAQIAHKKELIAMENEMDLARNRHRAEVLKLQDELKRMQESHDEDMSVMLDAIDSSSPS